MRFFCSPLAQWELHGRGGITFLLPAVASDFSELGGSMLTPLSLSLLWDTRIPELLVPAAQARGPPDK